MQRVDLIRSHESLAAARLALREARYAEAIAHLAGCEDWPLDIAEHAVVVKADALMRRNLGEGLALLTATQDLVNTPAGRFHRELLTGRGFANARNFNTAESRLGRAARLLDQYPQGAPKLAYQKARLRWMMTRDLSPDDPDMLLAITDPDPSGRAAAHAVRAWAYGSSESYIAQIAEFRAALRTVKAAGYACDVATLGTITHALARVSFETADIEGVDAAREATEAIFWTPDVAVDHFQTLRALGWDAFMRGESARAQWLFRDASAAAPAAPWQAMAHLDRAYVARIAGHETWALDELSSALTIARGIAWGETFGEERLAISTLAELLAPTDTAEAQRWAVLYSMLGTENVEPSLALSSDIRGVGFERYTYGRLDQMLGNDDLAEAALRRSYEIFADRDHHYHAMLAATALHELTRDASWAERKNRHIARYPGCPLAAVAAPSATSATDPILDLLTPLQRQIARAHCAGTAVDGLSKQFSRSRYTIEHQLGVIYAAFGVDSQRGLRDEAIRRGIAS